MECFKQVYMEVYFCIVKVPVLPGPTGQCLMIHFLFLISWSKSSNMYKYKEND